MTVSVYDSYPDASALRDWVLYGPQDPVIFQLVERLVLQRGMRLSEIESMIRDLLVEKLERS